MEQSDDQALAFVVGSVNATLELSFDGAWTLAGAAGFMMAPLEVGSAS